MSIPYLKTKLIIPPQRQNMVTRPRLNARLEEGQQAGKLLTLVSARAGSGKTTLVSDWVRIKPYPAAWVSLDESDNNPLRFMTYLSSALAELGIKTNQAVISQLESPQSMPSPEDLITEFSSLLKEDNGELTLIFDDYHLIRNEWIHQAVEFLIEYRPADVHLICITRADPPFPVARWRVRGQIVEVRDKDLRFSGEEAGEFFKSAMALDLPPQAVSTLEGRTEGWIAGLQLAALSMQGRQEEAEQAAFITAFNGTNRFILDYLMDEVLAQQSPTIQEFLLETAVLDRMCGGLCDAVRSPGAEAPTTPNSQTILEQLERANLFVIPLDDGRHWYRYHHLFSDLLKSTLKQKKTEAEIQALHQRASRWHHKQGSLEEAMHHAMAAQDYQMAARLIDENLASMFSRNDIPVLLGWIEKLPEEIVQGQPWITVHRANTLVISGKPEEVEPLLQEVETQFTPETPRSEELKGHIAAIRAYAANLSGDSERAIEMAQLAQQYLPLTHMAGQGMAAYTLADTYIACDDLENASQALEKMVGFGEKSNQSMLLLPAMGDLAHVRMAQGRLHQAKEILDKAYQWLADHNGLEYRLRCSYEFGIAEVLLEWNQLEAAEEHANTGDAYRRKHGGYLMVGDLILMRTRQACGDSDGALEALRTAEQIMQAHQIQLAVQIEFRAERVRQWLAVGDIETASEMAEAIQTGSEREQIALAHLLLAQNKAEDAALLLERQASLAEAGKRNRRLIEILSLQAVALSMLGREDEAMGPLSQALLLAQPEGYLRTFLTLGKKLKRVLVEYVRQGKKQLGDITVEYAQTLIDAYEVGGAKAAASPGQGLPSPLTDREFEVLQWLSEGLTNKEIASKMIVAPSTVKQHLKSIFNKLDVHTRTEAVTRGRELDLVK